AMVVPTADLIGPAWAVAKALDHSIYDCLYLACAEHTNQPLVTADRRFLDKARAKGRDASIRLLAS
ncbi:MAG TPA: type II toxin-antitoxin system VapC family toxin, partial [Salinarimonas sp.]|nr:type II toxin-antitoxin system VapC family toxin [Salinarimonas sp.]